jgi:hypothetical protein
MRFVRRLSRASPEWCASFLFQCCWLQALAHDFLASTRDDSLMKQALDNLKVFNAKRKFRAVAMACALGCKLQIRKRLSALMPDWPKCAPCCECGIRLGSALIALLDVFPMCAVSAEQLNRLMDEFRKAAIDGVLLGQDDFRTVIQAIGLNKLPISRMFDLFDLDGNGLVRGDPEPCMSVLDCVLAFGMANRSTIASLFAVLWAAVPMETMPLSVS